MMVCTLPASDLALLALAAKLYDRANWKNDAERQRAVASIKAINAEVMS